jgi:hypothetical protein
LTSEARLEEKKWPNAFIVADIPHQDAQFTTFEV